MKAQAAESMELANQPAMDLEAVFREHHAMVFRAAYRITGNADAERVATGIPQNGQTRRRRGPGG